MSDKTITIDDKIDLIAEDAKREILRLRVAVEALYLKVDDDDYTNTEALSAMLNGLQSAFDAVEEVEDRQFIF